MSPSSNVAAVLCHGGFLTPNHYMGFLDALRENGIEPFCPQLPSSDLSKLNVGEGANPDFDREPPKGGYPRGEDDVDAILDVIHPLVVEQGKMVLIIGHSAGGWTATQASRPELQAKYRKSRGLDGGIIGIFYIGAYIVPVGESILSFTTPADGPVEPPPFLRYYKHGQEGLSTIIDPEKLLFNDLDDSQAAVWATEMTAGAGVSLSSRLTNDAYAELPCGYVVLDNDRIVPKEFQEAMVTLQAQKTGKFTVYHAPSGHSPHLSWKDGLIGFVQDFIKGATK